MLDIFTIAYNGFKAYAQAGQEAFYQDKKTQDAIIRNLEVIGQAVRDYGTDKLIADQPEIPWAGIAGTRNILAHQYLGVDNELIWNIVEFELPRLEHAMLNVAQRMGIKL